VIIVLLIAGWIARRAGIETPRDRRGGAASRPRR
jgi:hypothetical protein